MNRSLDPDIDQYDAGELDVTLEAISVVFSKKEARNILIYPKIDCYIAFNNSIKEIFLPASCWTPVSIQASNFTMRAITDIGKAYWQAWYV